MPDRFFRCKKCPPDELGRPLLFHEDERDEFVAHMHAHGVTADRRDGETFNEDAWWDEEPGYSSPESHTEHTALDRSQFGDGSDQARKEIHKNTRTLAATSHHNIPASKFEGAKVLQPRAEAAVVQPPKVGLSAGKPATASARGVEGSEPAGVQREQRQSRSEKKGRSEMARRTNTENPYASAPVVNLTVGSKPGTGAPRICVTTGRGYSDTKAITSILALVQKEHPDAVIVNQGRWAGDLLVKQLAVSIGLGYEQMDTKRFTAQMRGAPLIDPTVRMTPEQDAEFGFRDLQHRMAETCNELHVFGSPSGPQRGLSEAFAEAEKKCFSWGSSTDDD